MLSYIVGFFAFLIFFLNPLSQLLWPHPRLQRSELPPLNESLLALDNQTSSPLDCPTDSYVVHIFSKYPLVLYIENLISEDEREHLEEISNPIFKPSTITHDGGATTNRDAAIRISDVALVPRTPTIRCVERRALSLTGWRDDLYLERLRTQRYAVRGAHYAHHHDWSSNQAGWGRVASFMAWVRADADLRGGGTEFPYLRMPGRDGRWCKFVECSGNGTGTTSWTGETGVEDGREPGVVFRPVAGNAVYWENFRPDGSGQGFDETWHAGLPVLQGVKIGLNIWSWGRIE